ncbi:MAG: hypothetical protein UZ13_02988 [Chloroflexi bacterium OLB13]|nr:MAG: hypothetical protein UZ13_02988 [Chloroflexi bacterium OLB13]
MLWRGRPGSNAVRERYSIISSSVIASRCCKGRISSMRSRANCGAVIVSTSEPDALTARHSTCRPMWSVSINLAEVLPP